MPISTSGAAWELQRNDEQAMAYSRIDKATGLQVCRVETVMKTSLNALVAMQRDAARIPQWMDGVKSSRIVQEADDYYITHTLVPSPWPVKDRDSVVRSDIRQQDDGSVLIEFASVEGVVPPQKNYERVQNVKGCWCFTPLQDGKTRVEYEVMVDPGGKLPAWLVNRFALDVPYNSIKQMHKLVRDPQYQQARSWIREVDPAY
ncbi:MAG: START domain-containing protein [Gammaproteobacteria bacterium]